MSIQAKNIRYCHTVAVIPVRGGSKRLPRKNILPLNGIPLLVHSILYAQENKDIIDEIIVSTDDAEIKKIALQYGVAVIDRPSSLSGDHTSTVAVLKHVLENYDTSVENVILLQATNPLRPKKMLAEAFEQYISGNYDSLMTVSRNYEKLGEIINQKFVPYNYKQGQRSQDLNPLYAENGLLYISKATLIKEEKILGKENFPFIVNHPFAKVDIDVLEDLKYATFVLNTYLDE